MTDNTIFRDAAPLYWAAGLPVIPLHPWDANVKSAGKRPIPGGWQQYASEMPSEAVRDHWLAAYPDSNIGLPFGSQSKLCAIDIDTEDPALIQAIEDCLPASPWRRVGKKGCGLIYRWQSQRNFKIKDENNNSICEFLGAGNQMVMPGSVHPDTGKPYTSNTHLWEVLGRVQDAPVDIEDRLRVAIGKFGIKLGVKGRSGPLDVIPSGERDTQMTRHAGYLARVVLGIDKTASFALQEAIDHMYAWVTDFVVKVPGDEMDPAKGVAKLLEFLLKDLERGRTMPEAWDSEMRDEWRGHPTVEALALKNARSRWSVSRAREWLFGKIAEKPSDDDWILARVTEMIALVAADEQFGDGDFRALVAKILPSIAGLGLKKGDLMVMFRAARKDEGEGEWEDQETLGRRVLEELGKGGEVRFACGGFWQWSGARWAELSDGDVYLQATSIKGSTLMRRNSDYEAIVKVCQRLAARELVVGEERGLNMANGWLDTGLTLVDHDPKFGATFTLPFNYEPGARCPRFMGFLGECWGRDADCADKISLLQEALAATMMGMAPARQKIFLLHGRPGTGKSVLLSIVRSLMPPEAVSDVSPLRWGERFALAGMIGRSLNICGEIPETGHIDGAVFKEVTEGAALEVEYKGRDTFSVKMTAAHWFAGNYLPATKDSSGGFARRWMILGFDHVVDEGDRIVGLADDIISEERGAIAAWALEALPRLLETGRYTQPASHLALVAEMHRINNSVLAWLESNGRYVSTKNGADTMSGMELYDAYVFHVKNVNRGWSVPYERFIQMLYDMGHGREQIRDAQGVLGWGVTGIRPVTV